MDRRTEESVLLRATRGVSPVEGNGRTWKSAATALMIFMPKISFLPFHWKVPVLKRENPFILFCFLKIEISPACGLAGYYHKRWRIRVCLFVSNLLSSICTFISEERKLLSANVFVVPRD